MKEIKEKHEQEKAKKQESEKQKAAAAAKKANKLPETVIEPHMLYKTSEYSAWDENNIPTSDKDSKEVTKSQVKKLTKGMEAHKKKYEKWMQLKSKQP